MRSNNNDDCGPSSERQIVVSCSARVEEGAHYLSTGMSATQFVRCGFDVGAVEIGAFVS